MVLDLIIWKFVNKFNLFNLFRSFSAYCRVCGKKYSETYINYFLKEKIECRKCKSKAIIFSKIVSAALNIICKALRMPNNQFRYILKNNIAMKRLLITYLEGIGTFGVIAPQIPGGPIITLWSITSKCNLNCNHCYFPTNLHSENELSYEEACKVIDQLYNARNMVLGFSGGEPLLRNDIFDLISYANKRHMSVALATNGVALSVTNAKKLKKAGLGYVQISIDGVNGLHDEIRGRGVFEKAIKGIKNCLNMGLYVSIDTVITKLNVNQIYDLINLAKELHVQKFEILDFVPSEKAANKAYLALTPEQIEKFGNHVCEIWQGLIKEDYPLTISYKNPVFSRILAQRFPKTQAMPFFKGIYPKTALKFFDFSNRLSKGLFKEQNPFSPFITGCEAGIYEIHIKSNGDITPCPLNPIILGNVRKHDIGKVWLNSSVLNEYRKFQYEGYCGKCHYKHICGGCRAKVYLHTGTFTESDKTCIYVNDYSNKNS